MKNTFKKTALSVAMGMGVMGGAASHACPSDPLVSSVCIMGMVNWGDFGGGMYALADGRLLSISQNTALYSLVGTTYGGDARQTFGIPDLRGRVVMGAGQAPGLPRFNPGETYGQLSTTLTTAQLPTHVHTLTAVRVDTSKMTATTTLSGLSATANLGGVNVSGAASGLTLNAATNATTNSPAGAALATASATNPFKMYSSGAPTVAMSSDSIGGNLSLTIASGTTAPVSINGNAATSLGGTASLSGTTDMAGASQSVSLMQPSLVLNYYIAVNGTYPMRN